MNQIQLRFGQGLVFRRIHNVLPEVSELCIKPSIRFNVDQSIEVVSLRHTRRLTIRSKHAKPFHKSIARSITKVWCEVIWVHSIFALDVVFGKGGFLFFGEIIGVELYLLGGEEFIGGEIGAGGKLFPDFVPDVRTALFPLDGLRTLLLLLCPGSSFSKVFFVALLY